MIIYYCDVCGLPMVERPSVEKGRCPDCGHKLYPDGYHSDYVPDGMAPPSYYPAPSWEEDTRDR